LVTVSPSNPVSQAILLMNQYGVSQIPVVENNQFVGAITDKKLFEKLCEDAHIKEYPVKNIMEKPFPEVDGNASLEEVSKKFQNGVQAVLVNYDKDKHHIITQQDMIKAIA